MIGRLLATIIMLLLAFGAFWGDAIGAGYSVAPVCLVVAAIVWFKWEIIRQAFGSVKDESNLPILRMGYKIIQGMGSKKPLAHSSSSDH
jgi:hypothetical protein